MSGTKILLQRCTEIFRHLLSRYFKNAVVERQEMMQCKCFFWYQTEKILLEKLSNEKGFWLRCESVLFSMSSELRFLKWVRFFERNCIVKWVIFWASFCWLWGFLLVNQGNKKTLVMSIETCGQIWKCCMPQTKIIFQKKEFQLCDFESFTFWSKLSFLGDCFKAF